jgi:hypothetical protein
MATLTHEQQSLVGAIVLTGMPAPGASLAGVVGIHFHRHTACQHRLVGNVAMQFGKGPLGGVPVRSSLLLRGLLPMPAFGAFTDVSQFFQADDAVWVLVHHAPTDLVVGSSFQPSLPSTNHYQSPGGGTGAFVLQPLAQSCIVVRFGSGLFAGIEGGAIVQLCGDRQVALPDIDTDHVLVGFGRRVCYLQFKGDEQVKLLAWLVIPQFGSSDVRGGSHESKMLLVARVGDNDSPIQGEDAHLLLWFQAVIPVGVVGERRGDVLGWLIEALVAFLGDTCLACSIVLLRLRPQGLVGSPDLAGDVTGHLGRQMIGSTYCCIRLLLQPFLVALLAMCKRVATHIVQGVAVRKTRFAQWLELGNRRMQFQFGGDHLLHSTNVQYFTENVKCGICEQFHPTQAPVKDSPFLKRPERWGFLARTADCLVERINQHLHGGCDRYIITRWIAPGATSTIEQSITEHSNHMERILCLPRQPI